jgi:hypothetical protein
METKERQNKETRKTEKKMEKEKTNSETNQSCDSVLLFFCKLHGATAAEGPIHSLQHGVKT